MERGPVGVFAGRRPVAEAVDVIKGLGSRCGILGWESPQAFSCRSDFGRYGRDLIKAEPSSCPLVCFSPCAASAAGSGADCEGGRMVMSEREVGLSVLVVCLLMPVSDDVASLFSC